ncbi:MAG: hypothetical protein GF344_00995, partial [Chitinivibrionales bacterium]|nr:hypothetical protein [Chitinivibrionales bacterium]MBD3355681.1 hypothetical protein [Chitinivibrionales bacterium]
IDVEVECGYYVDSLNASAKVNSEELVVRIGEDSSAVRLGATESRGEVWFEKDGMWGLGRLDLGMSRFRVALMDAAFTAETVSVGVLSWKEPTDGRFETNGMEWGGVQIPPIQGDFILSAEKLAVDARSRPLPEAQAEIIGSINWREGAPAGTFRFTIPWFELKHDNILSKWIPVPASDVLTGFYTGKSYLQWEQGNLTQRMNAVVREGNWRRPAQKTGILGINGAVVLESLVPPQTAAPQRLVFDSAYTSGLGIGKGAVVLSMGGVAPLLLQLVECSWAGGTLKAYGVKIIPEKKAAEMVLQFSGQQLQELLDIFEFKGAKATGTVNGRLPVNLDWGKRFSVSIGEGSLKAGMEGGTIRFTKETAEAILGIGKEAGAEEDELEKQVKVLMRRALEDMVYSDLSVTFINEPGEGTLAIVHLEGYGPAGTEENRIPIGSLDVRIHDIGKIIDSIIRGGGKGRIEVR